MSVDETNEGERHAILPRKVSLKNCLIPLEIQQW